jgi:large subunit ribosomal protein L49
VGPSHRRSSSRNIISGFKTVTAVNVVTSEQVKRTVKGKQIPVYSEYKNGRTRHLTILRRYDGDIKVWCIHYLNEMYEPSPFLFLLQQLKTEMSKVCGGNPVEEFPGRLEVKGHHVPAVKSWLMNLGF